MCGINAVVGLVKAAPRRLRAERGVPRRYTAWRWLDTTPFDRARAGMEC
jgi:hypothetical protein